MLKKLVKNNFMKALITFIGIRLQAAGEMFYLLPLYCFFWPIM